jgi:hypothetical protein
MPPTKKIAFRAYPKIIFAWPVALASLGAGVLMLAEPARASQIGLLFMAIAFMNLIALAFEFSRAKSMTVAFGLAGLTSTAILLNRHYPIFRPLHAWLVERRMFASSEFYFALGFGFAAVFLGIFLRTRFDYWTLTSGELVHKRGFLGESERFPTSGLKLRKEITDVLQYLLLGAGRIILTVPGQPNPTVLENVLGSRRVEKFAEAVLDARIVRLEDDSDRKQSA